MVVAVAAYGRSLAQLVCFASGHAVVGRTGRTAFAERAPSELLPAAIIERVHRGRSVDDALIVSSGLGGADAALVTPVELVLALAGGDSGWEGVRSTNASGPIRQS